MLKSATVVDVEGLSEEPYASVLCYPKPSMAEVRKRLKELQELGVQALEFSGDKRVSSLPVLGKGCVGIVVVCVVGGQRVALKIRRVDADRFGMQREAEMLRRANSVGVAPKFLGESDDFLLMQFVDGCLLPTWLQKCRGKTLTRKVLREVLEQCWRLDDAGLDHGELSHAPKHVIVDRANMPFIVDFETASVNRRPSNVTSICQFLFFGGEVAGRVTEKLGNMDKETIVGALKRYKNDRTRKNFEQVLAACC